MTIEVEGIDHKSLPEDGIEEICKEEVEEDLKNGDLKPIDGVPITDDDDKIETDKVETEEAPKDEVLDIDQEEEEGEEEPKKESRLLKIAPPKFWEKWFKKSEPPTEASNGPVDETEMVEKQEDKPDSCEPEKTDIEEKQEEDAKTDEKSSAEVTIPVGDTETTTENLKEPEEDKTLEKAVLRDRIAMYRSKGYILAGVAVGLLVLVTIILVGTALTGNGLAFEEDWNTPVAVTECGPVEGHFEDGAVVFRGIPYALPPTGDRRWKPPLPFQKLEDCWVGTRQVHEFGPHCYQREVPGMKLNMSEDCLTLNVYSPSLSRRRQRPVVVYIPGSSLMGVSESDLGLYPSPKMSKDRDVVFVTFNFRRNAFGFMALDELAKTAHPPTSGNYGLQDQVAVLKWVQRNIQQFNGDPNKVTLLGHGAGATSALLLMASELSKGLFSKVWVTGPSVSFTNKTLADVAIDNEEFLRKLDCESLSCLKEKSAAEVLSAVPKSWYNHQFHHLPSTEEPDSRSLAFVDGYFLKNSVNELWSTGEHNTIPIVIGSNLQEYAMENVLRQNADAAEVSKYVRDKLDTIDQRLAEDALEFYISNNTVPSKQLHTMISDVRVTCPLQVLTRDLLNATGGGAHFYIVDQPLSSPVTLSSAKKATTLSAHGLDVAAILGQLDRYLPNATRSDRQFQHNLQELFYTFVHSGTPSLGSQPLKETPFTNYVGESVRSRSSQHESCDLWKRYDVLSKYAKKD
ncbi:neurotactin-like [Ornithodoros turicata]|uniref:neurotactin-like n=1 Tax=Ornithodoros turicata TaxID=34597 RepID=UPI003139FD02